MTFAGFSILAEQTPLVPGAVHVWYAVFPSDGVPDSWGDGLSEQERERAGHFRFERHKQRYVFAHHVLRSVVARYVHARPDTLVFASDVKGKPHLAGGFDPADLQFSLSHSHDAVLIACTRTARVGVDVEFVRDVEDAEQIVERFFSPAELTAFRHLASERRVAAFFAAWTRKEALVKAQGEGLGFGVDRFEVSLAPDEPAMLLRIDGSTEAARRWTLQSLSVSAGYCAAVAVEHPGCSITGWQWGE